MSKVSCIIPAYNEGARIAGVIGAVLGHPLVSEVIAVDDCSTDDTRAEIQKFPNVKLVVCAHNGGKSHAVVEGIRASHEPYILMLDGDLTGLTPADVTALIEPVLSGRADFSISLRGNALRPWLWIGLDYLSGERVFPRSLLEPHLDAIERLPGFGLESYMNTLLLNNKARIKVVWWPAVASPYKARKHGFWKGIAGEMRMLMNIVETVSLAHTGYQIIAMRRARV